MHKIAILIVLLLIASSACDADSSRHLLRNLKNVFSAVELQHVDEDAHLNASTLNENINFKLKNRGIPLAHDYKHCDADLLIRITTIKRPDGLAYAVMVVANVFEVIPNPRDRSNLQAVSTWQGAEVGCSDLGNVGQVANQCVNDILDDFAHDYAQDNPSTNPKAKVAIQ